MCIIIAKDKNVALPDKLLLSDCENANPDGIGFVAAQAGKLTLRKGLSLSELSKELRSFKESPVIIHFRLATSGKVDKGNCHPFPLSTRVALLRATELSFKGIAVAHNGVLDYQVGKKLSDTQEFVRTILARPEIRANLYKSEALQSLIGSFIDDDKLAFLNASGQILTIGEFFEMDGLLLSNFWFLSSVSQSARLNLDSPSASRWDLDYCSCCGKVHCVANMIGDKDFSEFYCESCAVEFGIV